MSGSEADVRLADSTEAPGFPSPIADRPVDFSRRSERVAGLLKSVQPEPRISFPQDTVGFSQPCADASKARLSGLVLDYGLLVPAHFRGQATQARHTQCHSARVAGRLEDRDCLGVPGLCGGEKAGSHVDGAATQNAEGFAEREHESVGKPEQVPHPAQFGLVDHGVNVFENRAHEARIPSSNGCQSARFQ
ncbi:MAG: hypothetical protein FJW39_14505 [Acidobacteria bacterium]|nr:hypothetical protein [Acidobacteriota bacterium]